VRTGSGGSRPAAGRATASCSGGHPQTAAASAADTNRPDTHRPDSDRGSGSSSGQPRRPRRPVRGHPDSGRGVRLPGRLRRDGDRPAAAVPAPRLCRAGCACSPTLANWVSRHVADGYRLSGRADTGRGLPDTGRPHASGLRTPATAAEACGHCGGGHAGQPAPSRPPPPPPPCPTGTGPDHKVRHRPAPRLTARRSVGWGSRKASVAPERQRRPGSRPFRYA
jgi:hypothetical protein